MVNRKKTCERTMAKDPVVEIRNGFLRGRTLRTEEGTAYSAFRGIPYAKPPIGELRFRAPQPAEPWTGVKDAGKEGSYCTQPVVPVKLQPRTWALKDMSAFIATVPTLLRRVGKMLRQSEDCLYLNVYSPELPRGDTAQPKPVLFWIHGGGFIAGDGDMDTYGPDYFIDMGVVVVSINYRLGPFGFLAVGTEDAAGNAGLKDQALALRWVRDNIESFGGDPHCVTIYGESAGAVSAHLHTLSPLSRGLFHAVIAGSGTALHEWAIGEKQPARASELGKLLGVKAETPAELVDALRKESAGRIMKCCEKMRLNERYVGHQMVFSPVVEPAIDGAFLSEEPEVILREGRQAPVPIIMGINNREGLLWLMANQFTDKYKPESAAELAVLEERVSRHLFLPDNLHAALTPAERDECHGEIIKYFFGDKTLSKETFSQFIDLFGDLCFNNALYVGTRLHAAAGTSPVYVYHMRFDGCLGFMKRLLSLKHPGVAHADELGYLFRTSLLPEIQLMPESPEVMCRKRLLKLWLNFMTTGNPTPTETREELGVTWTPAWQAGTMDHLDIGDSLSMRHEPPTERSVFWDELYRKYVGSGIL